MTDFQAKQICDLRTRGVGYRAIGSAVGLSRDIVRNYCRSHGLEGFATAVSLNVREQIEQGRACQCCGKGLEQPATGRRRKFCSDECRRKWWSAHQADIKRRETACYTVTCAYCGASFTAYGNRNRKYCSHRCYVRDRFWRLEEGREPYPAPGQQDKEGTA